MKSNFYWLSFAYPICTACKAAGAKSFVGVAIVRGSSLESALARAMELGIHPASEGADAHKLDIKGEPVPNRALPPQRYRERLLSEEEVYEIGGRDSNYISYD
jgi:hypothetical protein